MGYILFESIILAFIFAATSIFIWYTLGQFIHAKKIKNFIALVGDFKEEGTVIDQDNVRIGWLIFEEDLVVVRVYADSEKVTLKHRIGGQYSLDWAYVKSVKSYIGNRGLYAVLCIENSSGKQIDFSLPWKLEWEIP